MSTAPKRKKNLAWRKIEDEVVIIDLEKDRQFHELNDTAALIWELCDGETSVSAIAETIAENFEIAPEDAQLEVNEFITLLTEKALLA